VAAVPHCAVAAATLSVAAATLPGKLPASAEVTATTIVAAAPAKATAPLVASAAPGVTATFSTTSKEVAVLDDAMQEDPSGKENLQDDESNPSQSHERGRCEMVDESDDKKALSKRRRLADLSPEVNWRASERDVRPRSVQRA